MPADRADDEQAIRDIQRVGTTPGLGTT